MDTLHIVHRLMLGKSFGNQYLTKRETDVLKYVVLGYTAKRIGQTLEISFRTVETYIETLKMKLDCGSKGDISAVVIRSGLIRELGLFE
jgi:DNA-binding CsgD family transcriptional regulator